MVCLFDMETNIDILNNTIEMLSEKNWKLQKEIAYLKATNCRKELAKSEKINAKLMQENSILKNSNRLLRQREMRDNQIIKLLS